MLKQVQHDGLSKLFAIILLTLALSACGLKPLYSGGTSGTVAASLGNVEIAPIPGEAGFLMRNALTDRLTPFTGGSGPQYRLVIKLDDQLEGLGLRTDESVTREVRTLRARYQLIDTGSGETVLDATAGSDAGIDVTSSEYATIAAENTALENLSLRVADQIVARLSLYAHARARNK